MIKLYSMCCLVSRYITVFIMKFTIIRLTFGDATGRVRTGSRILVMWEELRIGHRVQMIYVSCGCFKIFYSSNGMSGFNWLLFTWLWKALAESSYRMPLSTIWPNSHYLKQFQLKVTCNIPLFAVIMLLLISSIYGKDLSSQADQFWYHLVIINMNDDITLLNRVERTSGRVWRKVS